VNPLAGAAVEEVVEEEVDPDPVDALLPADDVQDVKPTASRVLASKP
jgi:hypothetical protein